MDWSLDGLAAFEAILVSFDGPAPAEGASFLKRMKANISACQADIKTRYETEAFLVSNLLV